MADSATTNKRLRKQSLGSNANTWGDTKLNEVLDAIDQCMDGYESIALTGNTMLTTTNYTTADQAKYRVINFTGTAGAVSVTFPSVAGWYLILNNTNGVVTCLCSGGTGVAIPAGYIALIYGTAIDMFNGAPMLIPGAMTVAGQIHGVTAGTSATDAVNLTQMSTAIATAGLPATSGTVLNSATDTTAGYLSQKITSNVSGLTTTQISGLVSIQTSTVHAAGNEQTLITLAPGYVGAFLNGGYQNAQFTPVVGNGYDVDCTASGVTVNLAGMTTPQLAQKIELNKFGAFNMFLLGTVNGGTNFPVTGNGSTIYRYSGAAWGWN